MNESRSSRRAQRSLERRERNIRTGQNVRIAVLLVAGALLIVWALANRDDVDVDWVFTNTTSPLILVMLAAAFLGFLLGFFVARRRSD